MIGYAKGTVDKIFTGPFGVGVVLAETFVNRDGEQKTTKVTAWFDTDPGVNTGDQVEVSGLISAKAELWTGDDGVERNTAKLNLNKARLSGFAALAPAEDLPF